MTVNDGSIAKTFWGAKMHNISSLTLLDLIIVALV